MAAPTFGATAAVLEERYWGGKGILGLPHMLAMAGGVLDQLAADVETALSSVSIDASDIAEATSPKAWRWLTDTILFGAAAELTRRSSKEGAIEVADAWESKFRDRIRQIRIEPQNVLSDYVTTQAKATVYEVLV
jgi:hypothetical protein